MKHTHTQSSRLRIYSALCIALAAASGACERPAPPGPELTLELVRRALVTRDRSIAEHTDARFVAEVAFMRSSIEAIRYASHGHAGHNETLTPTLFSRTWEELQRTTHDPFESLAPARPWLGGGRCVRIGTARVPPRFAPLATADESWPASLVLRHAEVNRALPTLFALRFRCAPGVAVIVTYKPTRPNAAPTLLAIDRE
ncbi:MAG: hypothetical protein JNK05_21070 [Myxococcales bacterium]|nr:hypothetical protein [Myxococcales bacterium]